MVEPHYYVKNGLSPLKAFEQGLLSKEEYIGFLKGNVIKYTIRAGEKTSDPLMDIIKAMDYLHYLHKALKEKEDENENNVSIDFKIPEGEYESELKRLKQSIIDFKKEYNIP